MTDHPCPVCAAPAPTTVVCWACAKRIGHLLVMLGEDLAELYAQLNPAGHRTGGAGSRAAETPLPVNLRAVQTLDDVRTVLVGWTREACEHEGGWPDEDTEQAMLRRLRRTRWASHPAADELLDELEYTHTEVLAVIDNPPERRYLGPCGAVDEDGNTCDGDVIQRGTRMPKCRDCGASHSHDERMAWITDMAADRLVTASEAAGALSAWGEQITSKLVHSWADRGRIMARARNQRGHQMFRFGDVRVLAADAVKRRRERMPG